MKKKSFANLLKQTIKPGLCTGCGTCVGVCPEGVLQFDFEREEPVLQGKCVSCGICVDTCPGADIPLPELEEKFLGETRSPETELLGVSRALYKGFARDPEMRRHAASGGLTTALCLFGLEKSWIGGAIAAGMNRQRPWRAEPVLARTKDELMAAAKSKYTICPNNVCLKDRRPLERLAVVGLPCHIHGIRKIQAHPELAGLAGQISITLGLYCGSNRTHHATEHIIEEYTGVRLEEIAKFEYRGGSDSQDVKI